VAKKLVIVESPNKTHKIQTYLGNDFEAIATSGHFMDLPQKSLGVKTDDDFAVKNVVVPGKENTYDYIQKKASKASAIYVATDLDREGEKIAADVSDTVKKITKAPVYRMRYTEITKAALQKAVENVGELDENLIDAQLARRITDRLCGYKTSFVTKQSTGGSSAGRVQSVALRLIVERCREIAAFVPEEYWEITAYLLSPKKEPFAARLEDKVKVPDEKTANEIYSLIKKGSPVVAAVESKMVEIKTKSPFNTTLLISASKSILGWSNTKTMSVAQQLFEGGNITYHRSDAVSMAPEAFSAVCSRINKYGSEYLAKPAYFYKNKDSAQAAHEGIRICQIEKESIDGVDQNKLYRMIWKRTIASQMTPLRETRNRVEIDISGYKFIANGSSLVFDGFTHVWDYNKKSDVVLPNLKSGDICTFNLEK